MNPTLSATVDCHRAGPDRIDDLLSLEASCFLTDRINRRNMRHLLKSPSACCIGAYCENQLIGGLILLFRITSRSARIYSLAVLEQLRGKGVGQQLLKEAEKEALRRGCTRLRLEVRQENLPAIRLYERLGFQLNGIVPQYYEDGEDAAVMYKEISE